MGKIIRFYNQNRKVIYKWISIIAFGYLLLRLANWYYEEKDYNYEVNSSTNNVQYNQPTTNNKVNDVKNNKQNNVLDSFIDYCKSNQTDQAYNLLSSETKEKEEYSTKEKFIENFISNFINSKTQYLTTKLSSTSNIYMIEGYSQDILSSGNVSDAVRKYATIKDKKIILSDYIEIEKSNKIIAKDNIEFKLNTVTYYYDYMECELQITNNSESSFDINEVIGNVYISVNNQKKFLNKEEVSNLNTIIEPKNNTEICLKFDINYKTERWNIENLILYEQENIKLKL